MSLRAVYRFIPHTIRHAPEGGVVYEAHCAQPGCSAESGAHEVQEAAQDWALRHTGRTGHALFRRVVTDYARVARAE
ncbi:hypothetical protein [Streptomyces sp. PSKA30]|uniref:DUF7848 domain-containing protein n=1 Tax=Streptomyces sp. PSKA30 TaxID=2874597 RepID=UPI001CD055FB|nr:hypothetical protein [Streptomyces sp. PSKA30]MBZ9640086.1 hypothetical protein [Streptomyces sp. PSKA30]